MSLLESIDALVTDTITVRRRPKGAYNDAGKYEKAEPSTLTADVVMQPAFGLNRVIGGADMRGMVDNQRTTDVLHFFTRTEMKTLSKDYDADEVIDFRGGDWTVTRVEPWPDLDGGYYYHALITRQAKGAA